MIRALTADCDRWSAAKLVVGIAFTFCLLSAMMAASVLIGWASFSGAFPRLNASPLTHLAQNALAAIALAALFGWCEERSRPRIRKARLMLGAPSMPGGVPSP